MAAPWFEPLQFIPIYLSIAGGGGGGLIGSFGAMLGTLAARGIGRPWMFGYVYFLIGLGVAQVVFGLVALAMSQPFYIWFLPLLCGLVYIALFSGAIPLVRHVYRWAENRQIEIAALRGS